ncbi:hypothetical protein PR048_014505 [Dryococelus australis]|uniref:HAT C-terminal dimerisation domain-containing protein n=1 Tax=Dryococelus australis TaxID=614101 RepID=A0ABQ9HEF4_9NEOP|nr:hypothetical protein PR048_014505 [Dryococelus australis]
MISELAIRFPKSQLQIVGQIQKLLSPEFRDSFEDEVLQGAEPSERIGTNLEANVDIRNIKKSFLGLLEKATKSLLHYQEFCFNSITSERSFSTLRRLKNYLRSTMIEDRLNGLALLHIHQDTMKPEEVLDIFARKHTRKLSLNFL